MKRSTTSVGHSEERRKRIAEALEKVGDGRLQCKKERLFEHLEDEEDREKKTKRNSERDVKANAPSSSSSQVPS